MKLLFAALLVMIHHTFYQQTEKHKFQSFDGTTIAYTMEGEGEPVILIHGFISSGSSWANTPLKGQLINQGYQVIVPDLRGNGQSDKSELPERYENDSEVKDLIALATHLKLKTYTAIGYSRGSIVLAKLLTQDERINKAVLGGMGLDFTDPNWTRRIAFADAFSGRSPLNDMTEGAVNYAKSIGANVKILGHLQDYQPVTSIAELNQIDVRCLVIAGDEDKDNGDPAALKNELSNSQLVIVPGTHNETYKTAPFAMSILTFLMD